MPPVNRPDDIASVLADLERRVAILERSPQLGSASIKDGALTIYDSTGAKVMVIGKQADATYGLVQFDGSGNKVIVLGAAGVAEYNSAGVKIIQLGKQADGTYGLSQFNPAGTELARMGQLSTSPAIYGVAVLPYGGSTLQQVGGTLFGAITSVVSNAVAWTAFSPTGLVTAQIGPSGEAEITLVGRIATGDAGQEGFIGVLIDGATTPPAGAPQVRASESVGVGGLNVSGTTSWVATGLSAGTHTFQPAFLTANNGALNVGFSGVAVIVNPL